MREGHSKESKKQESQEETRSREHSQSLRGEGSKQFVYTSGARRVWKLYWEIKKTLPLLTLMELGEMNNFYSRDCKGELCLN